MAVLVDRELIRATYIRVDHGVEDYGHIRIIQFPAMIMVYFIYPAQ